MDGRLVRPWGCEFDHRAQSSRCRWRVRPPSGITITAHGSTRQRAFEVACALAAAGKRPTIAAVREGLDGKGSQQAIGAGIDDWLDEAARRFQIPGIPEALRTQVVEVWDQARQRDRAERVAAASADSLKAAQERIARLQVEQEVATARAELLERAEATARESTAQVRTDLEAAQAMADDLLRSGSERNGQLATLTATVQAEQQSRDADAEGIDWLGHQPISRYEMSSMRLKATNRCSIARRSVTAVPCLTTTRLPGQPRGYVRFTRRCCARKRPCVRVLRRRRWQT